MDRRTTLNLLVSLLLAGSLLATLPGANGQTGLPAGHETLVKQNQGAQAPYGSWTKVGEEVTLYLDRETTYPFEETPVGAPYDGTSHAPAGNGDTGDDYFLTYEKSPAEVPLDPAAEFTPDVTSETDKKVIIESNLDSMTPARWTLPLDLTPSPGIRIYGIEATIYGRCMGEPPLILNPLGNPPLGLDDETVNLDLHLDILDLVNGNWIRKDMATGTSGHQPYKAMDLKFEPLPGGTSDLSVFAYTNEIRFENPVLDNGRLFDPAVMRIQVSIMPDQDSITTQGDCVVHFGTATYPSHVRILADSGRINMWHENLLGEETQGVSNATRTAPDRRRFLTQVIHSSAWPNLNQYRRDRPDPVNYMDDLWDTTDNDDNPGPGDVVQGSTIHYRVRDLQTLGIVSGTGANDVQVLDRDVFVLGSSLNRIEYLNFYPGNLRDGKYRAEAASSEFGAASAPDLTVGLKGFTFTPLDGLEHGVNAKEPTEFRFRVRNVGGEDDTVTVVASPPGSNWVAEVVGASTHFLRANGGEAEVVVRVTPPQGAVAPTQQSITVTAASASFPNEVTPVTQTLKVNIIAPVKRGVDLTLNRTAVTLQPGVDTALAGVRVRNNGTAGDTFVLQPVLPSSAAGWTVQATPLSKFILANSSSDFSLRIRAPADAPAGQTFTLPIRVTRLGDTTVSDAQDLVVTVVVRHGLELAFPASLTDSLPDGFEAFMAPRDTTTCAQPNVGTLNGDCVGISAVTGRPQDDFNDHTFLYRILVTNPGSVVDTYRVTMSWQPKAAINSIAYKDTDGSSACDGNDGDRPDFWSARYNTTGLGMNSAAPFEKFITRQASMTVPARSTLPLYIELSYEAGACGHSRAAPYRVVLRSQNDPSLERTLELATTLIGPGTEERTNDFSTAVHDAEIEPDFTDPDRVAQGERGTTATHLFRVRNSGNELDNVVVTVPANLNGWTRSLTQVGSVPTGITCTANASNTRFVCPLGVYDEALFRLNVQSPTTAAVGNTDTATVNVNSGKDGAAGASLDFVTSVVGTFAFDAQGLVTSITAEKGKTTLLPFVLKNQGTSGDRLNLSIVQGDANWAPRLGLPSSNFVPAGRELSGFIAVTPPADATTPKLFRLQVNNQGNGPATQIVDTVDFTVTPVAGGALRVSGIPSNVTTLPGTGVDQTVRVNVVEPGGAAGRQVRVNVTGSLPNGWSVTPTTLTRTLSGATNPNTTFEFTVRAPSGALGASRLPLLLRAESVSGSGAVSGQGNLLLQLADVFGVKLAAAGPTDQVIVPGGEVVYNLTVANLGTSTDTIRMATSGAPTGWTIQTDPPELALGPLENRTVKLIVKAPANAAPKAAATTTLQASSLGSGAVSSVVTTTRVGFYELVVTGGADALRLAPTETGSLVFSVKNNGTIPDEVAVLPALVNSALAGHAVLRADPAIVSLAPNQTKQVRIDVTLGATPPSDSDIGANARFDSRLAPAPDIANVTLPVSLRVLPYRALDVDADGLREYAVDRDGNDDNGFEGYLDTAAGGGKASALSNLTRYLSEGARAQHTRSVVGPGGATIEVTEVQLDGDGDQMRDLLIDANGDGLPDSYWDPDAGRSSALSIVKDIDADAVPDYFVDVDNSTGPDKVYNLRSGTFVPVLAIDLDGDGTKDFAVDRNANGVLDADESVVYSRDGRLVTVQKVDMDGNDALDSVFDVDGDGVPDYFIRAGEEEAIEIVLRDINGDGTADWAFDSNGDGRLDSYYDPTTKSASLIDSDSSFLKGLREHWYIGALFGVVLVLFVVLLIVTRR